MIPSSGAVLVSTAEGAKGTAGARFAVSRLLPTFALPREDRPLLAPKRQSPGKVPRTGFPQRITLRVDAAILDRQTFNGSIIEAGTDTFRLAHTNSRRPNALPGKSCVAKRRCPPADPA